MMTMFIDVHVQAYAPPGLDKKTEYIILMLFRPLNDAG